MSSRMVNHYIVQNFVKKLDSLSCSDYHGLISPGLTCYLNSVIQVLFLTKDFKETVKRSSKKNFSSVIDSQLADLFYELQSGSAKTHDLVQRLGITEVWEQRDAAEYLERVLSLSSEEASKMFRGQMSHVTVCKGCQDTSTSSNNFWILPLAMEDSSSHPTYNVSEGVTAFFKVHQVDGENQVYCNRCSTKQDADIKWVMKRHPDVLTLLLKRFTFNHRRNCFDKLHCNASLPQRLQGCMYDLYAIISHLGSLTGGHYTAEIRSFELDCWYHFDDGVVKNVNKRLFKSADQSLSSSTAYLLLYRKLNKKPDMKDGGEQRNHHHCSVTDDRSRDVSDGSDAPSPQQPLQNDIHHRKLPHNGFLHKQESIPPEGKQTKANLSPRQRRPRASSLPPRQTSVQQNRKPVSSNRTEVRPETQQTGLPRGRARWK